MPLEFDPNTNIFAVEYELKSISVYTRHNTDLKKTKIGSSWNLCTAYLLPRTDMADGFPLFARTFQSEAELFEVVQSARAAADRKGRLAEAG